MRRQRRSFTDIICENCKYLPTKRSRNKRKPIPKESDVKPSTTRLTCGISGGLENVRGKQGD
ncbi:NinE family protein [Escherichia coli]|uniref:NinE family protein n=1 Tax=Escherichia coli TaxID=562 RepID=UPI0032ECAEB3